MLLDDLSYLADCSKNRSNLKILNYSIDTGSLSHAYIFCGNSINLLFNIALSFAASINCENNGCGSCHVCRNTLKGIYENIIILEPEGNFITMDRVIQLQKFMSVSAYSPGYKVCIIREADLLNKEAANRLLKTLEDPPDEKSIFILLTEDLPAIMPTVSSRCIIFEWDFLNAEKNNIMNLDEELFRKLINEGITGMLSSADGNSYKDCLELAARINEYIKGSFKNDDEEEGRSLVEMYKKTGAAKNEIKKLEESLKAKNKRKLNKFINLGINYVFDIIAAWLEDILSVSQGASKEALNVPDNFNFIKKYFSKPDSPRVFALMDVIEKNRKYLKYSIYPELALDNIFLQMKLLNAVN